MTSAPATDVRDVIDEIALRASSRTPAVERSDTRRRILEVAIEQFATRGFEACTVRDLATAVGIKAPGIYSHFSAKEEILSEAMILALTDFLTYVAAPSEATHPRDRLRETVHRHVLYQVEHLRITRANDLLLNSEVIGRWLPSADHELLVKAQRAYFELVRNRVTEALSQDSPIDPTTAAFAVITMCDRVTGWYRPDGRLTPRELADEFWQLVRGMLRL